MKKILLVLLLICTNVSAQEKKVYIDDCEHWYQIAIGMILIKHDQEYSLYEALKFVDQYLTESNINKDRKRKLIQRVAEVWIENSEISSELLPNLYEKCDVK